MTSRRINATSLDRKLRMAAGVAAALLGVLAATGSLTAQSRDPAKARAISNAGAEARSAADEALAPNPLRGLPKKARPNPVVDEEPAAEPVAEAAAAGFLPEQLLAPEGLGSTLQLIMLMTVLSVVPSILIMTTCFVRFTVVLGLLRQALGTQQLPPNQVMMALCMFLTFMVMSPVWQQSYDEGIRPYTSPEPGEPTPTLAETFERSVRPVRHYMSDQIERAGNSDTIWMFLDYQGKTKASSGGKNRDPKNYDEVELPTLISSFMLSELKSAFLIGFKIYLPFLVIDLVVATVLMSMGMMMVPPALVSFPFKLLMFVLIDGWTLTVGMMLASVGG